LAPKFETGKKNPKIPMVETQPFLIGINQYNTQSIGGNSADEL